MAGNRRPAPGERAAAWLALLALAGAAVLTGLGLATHLAAAALGLLGLLVCVTACWYVVSRRGLARITAAFVAVATLAAWLTGFALTASSAGRLALIGVLAAGSVGTARYALRHTARATGPASTRHRRVRASARPVLLLNPASGGGKAERFHLADECRKRGVEPVILRQGSGLRRLAEDAIQRGADTIGMAGGDGSQALVAAVAAKHGIPYVCVPAGTRNHFALDLGLDRDDVVQALDAFTDPVERRIDLATVNGRVFVNNVSLGLYASVVASPQYRDAKLRTAATMLPGLLGPDGDQVDLRFRGPDGEDHPGANLVLVSNNPYHLVASAGLGTRERMDGAVLGIVAVRLADAADARRFVALELAGQLRRFPGWLEWQARRFEVSSAGPVPLGVDGEAVTMGPPLIFESWPAALRVRLPRGAHIPGRRPAHLLAASTVAELGRIAAGEYPA